VIRRALEAADQQPDNTALADLEAYHHKGGLVAEKADSYLKEWSESREDWGS